MKIKIKPGVKIKTYTKWHISITKNEIKCTIILYKSWMLCLELSSMYCNEINECTV